MNLSNDFQFSQASLQDYVDCRRRFLLRYILRLSWPAVETEPFLEHERYLQQGATFHRLAQQHLLGIPAERLETMIHDPDLERWWQHFKAFALGLREPGNSAGFSLYPEFSLSAPLGGFRIVAKFDLVAVSPQGLLLIYDWKTSRSQPRRKFLEKRLQTRVYPYLLARSGEYLNQGRSVQPDLVEMIYWFANHPEQQVRFPYNHTAYQADESYLEDLIGSIQRLEEAEFHLTADERRCAFCTYRSLCNRGTSAGSINDLLNEAEMDGEENISLDFEQIAEIEF